jgi:hypothetical protein
MGANPGIIKKDPNVVGPGKFCLYAIWLILC